MTSQSSLPLGWRENSPDTFSRPTNEIEQSYITLAKTWEKTGHTFFAITACATISLSIASLSSKDVLVLEADLEHALRSAWKKMRYDHATLAATTAYNSDVRKCIKTYKNLTSENEAERWMKATFKVIDNGQSGREFANTDPDFGHLATLFIVTPPLSLGDTSQEHLRRDIVLRSPHELIDGIGTLMFYDNFFRNLASAFASESKELDVNFGDESKNLSPSFIIAAGIPETPSEEQLNKLVEARKAGADAAKDAELLSYNLPFNSTSSPGNSNYLPLYFTPSETSSILAKCKVAKVTPTQAFHAGIAFALRNIQERSPEERVANRHITPPASAAGVYHSISAERLVVELTIPSLDSPPTTDTTTEDFHSALKQVSTFYHKTIVNADFLAIVPAILQGAVPPYPETTPEIPLPNQTPTVSLSSMGIIDRIIQPKRGFLEIDDPWVMGAEYATGIGLFLGTWRGKLRLSAGYNAAYHDEEKVMRFLRLVKQVVFDGMEA